jgi:hypothetical protein
MGEIVETEALGTKEANKPYEALSKAPRGAMLTLASLGGDPAFRGRMMAIGLYPGASVSVVAGGDGLPYVLELAGGKMLVDTRSASMISVRIS